MADNVTLPAQDGTIIAFREYTQNSVLKKFGQNVISFVNSGSITDVDDSNGLPVTVGNFPADQTVSGTVDIGNFPASQTIDGTVSVDNFPADQQVSGTVDVGNFPADQPVSGTVDVGNFPASQTIDGTVSVDNFPATQDVALASVPLAADAATAAKQDEAKASLDKLQAFKTWAAIAPEDGTDISGFDGIYIGVGGVISMDDSADNNAVFTVQAGQILMVSPKTVEASGTTASGIVGLNV